MRPLTYFSAGLIAAWLDVLGRDHHNGWLLAGAVAVAIATGVVISITDDRRVSRQATPDAFTEGAVRQAAILLATCRRCRNRMGYLGDRDAGRYALRRLLVLHLDHSQHGPYSDADTDEPVPN